MKKNISLYVLVCTSMISAFLLMFAGCTKVDKGFLSPTLKYSVTEFSIIRGRYSQSYALNLDGSTTPAKVRWVHIYDEAGKIVDSLFSKKYPVTVWTTAYDSKADTTYAKIKAKQATIQSEPVIVNESNGSIVSNAGSLYLPLGRYSMDIEVSNVTGSQVFKNMITLVVQDGKSFETTPEQGAYSIGTLLANTPTGGPLLFNGNNNPFVVETITRVADTPNLIVVKVHDKTGRLFNPKNNEIMKRPASGLNPNPPFLQNLQDYAPDTFNATDTAMTLRFPLVPFPIISLGNGFNMYYRLPTQNIIIDSTTSWTSNTAGNYYKGTSDSHYKGVFQDGKYDYSLRIPMRVQVPGSYILDLKLLNVQHK